MPPVAAVALGLLMTAAWPAVPARGDEPAEYETLLAAKAPTLVTIKFVLKVKMGGMMGGMGDNESETEITGVMVDPKGLVLCSNTQLGGFTGVMKQFMGGMGGGMSATPSDIKVLAGEDTEGLEAKLLARDSDLDLAWIQIKEPGEKTFASIDFSKGATAKIGERLLTVKRMEKHFDRVPAVAEGRVGGMTKKPRDLYLPSGDFAGLGLPVFTPRGEVVGFSVLQLPEAEESGGNPFAMMSRLSSLTSIGNGMILTAAEVHRATQRAKESPAMENAGDEGVKIEKQP